MFRIHHLGNDPRHHVVRVNRLIRRTQLILQDGQAIKRRGARSVQLDGQLVVRDLDRILEAVRNGIVEIECPNGLIVSPDNLGEEACRSLRLQAEREANGLTDRPVPEAQLDAVLADEPMDEAATPSLKPVEASTTPTIEPVEEVPTATIEPVAAPVTPVPDPVVETAAPLRQETNKKGRRARKGA